MMILYYDEYENLIWYGTEEDLTAEVLNAAHENGWIRVIKPFSKKMPKKG